ncbi:MAG: large-conductance mechanosensitive channel protein MscL [Lactobacillaceae bacterium]|jgi:large conductance mechanosensitive channel|nr:large-conductance mechanosensitive channel protein MscL [Lactobacillaceae bacterium]
MLQEFKKFIMRGNVIDLAVGVIIGAAFTAIVNSIVTNLISPLIAIFTGSINLSKLNFTIGQAHFQYGEVINSLINFLLTGLVLFFIVKSLNKALKRKDTTIVNEVTLLTEIRDLLVEEKKRNSK